MITCLKPLLTSDLAPVFQYRHLSAKSLSDSSSLFNVMSTAFNSSMAMEPFANLAYVNLKTDSFSETDGVTALNSRGDSSSGTTFTTLGLRANTKLDSGPAGMSLRGTMGWRHAFGAVSQQATLGYAGGNGFAVSGVPIAKDAAVLEAGLDFALRRDLTLGVSYNGQIGDGVKDHGVRANLLWKF